LQRVRNGRSPDGDNAGMLKRFVRKENKWQQWFGT
jgi:hypothetical protein